MVTRAKAGIFKPRHRADLSHVTHHALHVSLCASTNPKDYKSALKNPTWVMAMHNKHEALHKNRTKFHYDGSIECHKARLVAQGYSQTPGIDYSHTFSPVVKASNFRIILSLAVLNNWNLHQLDVNNVFLHGYLNETIYMEQPRALLIINFLIMCALYGLKQAPRAWFHLLSTFLMANGLSCSRADTLNREFTIKDLGDINYFLGLEVTYTNDGLFLNQSKYAREILDRAKNDECKTGSYAAFDARIIYNLWRAVLRSISLPFNCGNITILDYYKT
ncbi:hypothetical protein OSB04_028937 [Centaurea solstitialis]|uniref:Reverse transcriptase Ty1/copia-type domain-containing protein n=1 Tax=Centaurea solstitialis TaxID=347529 RepID=A0AA38SV44_9ASTR|nr:hypothetical protein OSB04_028937 [Centaurea solstitialis]